jgi:hypothetical protein
MTVSELISQLSKSPPDMDVLLDDPETGNFYHISEINAEKWNGGLDARIPAHDVLVLR